jgi:hypothetical protein
VGAQDAKVSLVKSETGERASHPKGLHIITGHNIERPQVTLKPAKGRWNLSGYRHIKMEVTNPGSHQVAVGLRIQSPGSEESKNWIEVAEPFNPGETRTLTAELAVQSLMVSTPVEIVGMRAAPGLMKADLSNIIKLVIFVPKPDRDHEFIINSIRAEGEVEKIDADAFFPFIDEYGQFIHRDWPGKIHSEKDFAIHKEAEEKDLTLHPAPAARNKYGGWTALAVKPGLGRAGPQFEATGFFRTEKYQGKWWLVDPEGCLFWSHGVDCVSCRNHTSTSDREYYFRGLPDEDSPLARFYGEGHRASHGYYKDKAPFTTFSHQNANLYRKHGENWLAVFSAITHRRLKSWGLNTIGNWSAPEIYLERKTPYVATIHIEARKLEGSEGFWGKFHDVFDPGFRTALRQGLAEKQEEIGDPWCIGFFVDNELSWGTDGVSLALAALISPPEQPAKKAFLEDLRAKYDTTSRLNAAWGTEYAAWDALRESRAAPDQEKARDDLTSFYSKTAETYFRTIKEELARAAPGQLYLGCRFSWVNDLAARAASEFCDVVSYNKYTYTVENLRLPAGADKPLIIGEFHFGALDRGMFHTGLRKARNQKHRAELYKSYVEGALRNPFMVGTHWFQYIDQPTTGRGDGENYQIGFASVCDTPYPEIVKASREVGQSLYQYRLGTGQQ